MLCLKTQTYQHVPCVASTHHREIKSDMAIITQIPSFAVRGHLDERSDTKFYAAAVVYALQIISVFVTLAPVLTRSPDRVVRIRPS
jgi:cephalosporin-C deacetylase-like acetyl esterase